MRSNGLPVEITYTNDRLQFSINKNEISDEQYELKYNLLKKIDFQEKISFFRYPKKIVNEGSVEKIIIFRGSIDKNDQFVHMSREKFFYQVLYLLNWISHISKGILNNEKTMKILAHKQVIIYIPPNSNKEIYQAYLDTIARDSKYSRQDERYGCLFNPKRVEVEAAKLEDKKANCLIL